MEGLDEITYVRWVVSWLTNKRSQSVGWKLLFVLSIISFTKHLLAPPSLLSSSWSLPLPSVNQLVWSVSLSPTFPLPPHQPSHPPLSHLYLSLTFLSLSLAPLCSPVSHRTSASSWPISDSAESLDRSGCPEGFYGSENSGHRGREWRTANPWSGAPL